MKKCTLCGRDFEYRRLDRATKEICGSCMANRHRFALKAACVKYKGGACQLCGYNRCMRALTFHHLDPDKKGFGFGGLHNKALATIKAELDRCICLCGNCHDEVEDALQWFPDAQILTRVQEIAAQTSNTELVFSRKDWTKYHPALNKVVYGNCT